MKILVVGGAGYVGGHLVDVLSQEGHQVTVYDVLLYEECYRKNVPFIHGDIREKKKLLQALEGMDAVIWLAALVGDPACSLKESLTVEINKDSVQFLKDHYHGRIIFMSTCSVYGAADGVLTENSSLNPLSLYARTKLQAEEILKNSDAVIFRLGTLYGLGDRFSRVRFDLVTNTLVMRAALHGKFSVFGGEQYRPMLHVRDVSQAVLLALAKNTCKGIYNLSSENITIAQMAQKISNYFPQVQISYTDVKYQDQRNYRVSSQKAIEQLGFKASLNLIDGIKELKELLEQGRIKNSFLQRYSNYLYLRPLLEEYDSPLGKLVDADF